MKARAFLVFVFLLLAPLHGGASAAARRSLEVKRRLGRLNKPSVKSIKSPDGDIIDCVHISHQPAFDHPIFQNHTIQMRPSYHPEKLLLTESKNEAGPKPMAQLWHMNGRCPEGTVPMRRTKKEDLFRASSINKYGKKNKKSMPRPTSDDAPEPNLVNQNGHQHAIAYVEGDAYYGAKATINVWNPKIQQSNEFSLSQLWILGGSFASDLNSIEAGWQVSPDLYGDNNTRLFTYWTVSLIWIHQYNKIIKGSILHLKKVKLKLNNIGKIDKISVCFLIVIDPKEGNWWMQFGNEHVLGYWPGFLFSYLSESASMVEWGGEVVNSQSDGQHTTTQMGSGHFSEEGFGKASYVRNIQVVDSSNNLRAPKDIGIFTEQSSCYNVQLGNNGGWGNFFYYGGPGRNIDCP
ncbi:Protein of Unknown Function (DUF239 [Striga hermonthica]|uniref:Neprosin PEP catalytic domain-containing protein n=1 Tax=Striga hermonthica TaxID=68872 RepID=A0A9N7N5I4_STRHE|nr:Protein of Unknown Function (DUF239 [Striga hermonthica]